MATLLKWRDEWTLRINTLDEDHRAIVDILLDIASRFGEKPDGEEGQGQQAGKGDGASVADLCAALDRLGSFTREHFRREEEFMRTIDYPKLPHHRSEHALLMAEHTALVRDLRARGVGRLGRSELDDLKHWVVAHILGTDRGFADHYFKICGRDPDRR